MIKVFCGEDQASSRNNFISAVAKLQADAGNEILRFEGKSLTETDLIQAMDSLSMFSTNRIIVIENIFSLPVSKLKNRLIKLILEQSNDSQFIIWESKAITPSTITKIGRSNVIESKLPKILFSYLESLGNPQKKKVFNLLDQCKQTIAVEMIFFMTIRQIRLLLLKQLAAPVKLGSWQESKLSLQLKLFEPQKLIGSYFKLIEIDYQNKSGQATMELTSALDNWILEF